MDTRQVTAAEEPEARHQQHNSHYDQQDSVFQHTPTALEDTASEYASAVSGGNRSQHDLPSMTGIHQPSRMSSDNVSSPLNEAMSETASSSRDMLAPPFSRPPPPHADHGGHEHHLHQARSRVRVSSVPIPMSQSRSSVEDKERSIMTGLPRHPSEINENLSFASEPQDIEILQASVGSSTLVASSSILKQAPSTSHSKSTSGSTTSTSKDNEVQPPRISTSMRRDSGDVQEAQSHQNQNRTSGGGKIQASGTMEFHDGMEENEDRHRGAINGSIETPRMPNEHEHHHEDGHGRMHPRTGSASSANRVQIAHLSPPLLHARNHSRSRNSHLTIQESQHEQQRHSRRLSTPEMSPLMPLVFQHDLPIGMLSYTSTFARVSHSLYPLLYFLHVPITLYLDYSVLYALIQIALHPDAIPAEEGEGNRKLADGVGLIDGTTRASPWWIAVGFYALSTFCWFFIVFLLHDLYWAYYKRWNEWNPPILAIYTTAPSFHLSCTRSFSAFSFLWRIRLAAFTGLGSLQPTPQEGIIETSHLLMQNWPTVVTLIPRGFTSLLLLLCFTSSTSAVIAPPSSAGYYNRDDAYFCTDGTLTTYSIILSMINLSWAIWRTVLVLIACLTYFCTARRASRSAVPTRTGTPADSYTAVSTAWLSDMYPSESASAKWKKHLRDRVVEAVLLCSSSNRWRVSVDDPISYKQSRSTRHPTSKGRRKRKSTISMSQHLQTRMEEDVVDMQERPPSSHSFSVHLPRRSASAPQADNSNVDGGGEHQDIRVSSIPTRKMTISTESTASSLFSGNIWIAESGHTTYKRPFSALGYHSGVPEITQIRKGTVPLSLDQNRRVNGSIDTEALTVDEGLDDEERERLEWERHPPLTPRGSLVQAREELAYEQQRERSYWNAFNPTASISAFLDESESTISPASNDVVLPASSFKESRALGAIVEESDEEASLRRANSLSNKHTISSRQSSIRRPGTALSRIDEPGKVSVLAERPVRFQSESV